MNEVAANVLLALTFLMGFVTGTSWMYGRMVRRYRKIIREDRPGEMADEVAYRVIDGDSRKDGA